MSRTTTTTTSTNPSQESYMDIISPSPRPSRRLSAAAVRAARQDMAKVASFETLAGISARVRDVLDWADAQSDMEFQRARRAAKANRLAAEAASSTRGGI